MLENNYYKPTEAEKTEIFKQLLIQEVGYKQAQDLYEAALYCYNPIRYAVLKTIESLEKRDAISKQKKSMS